MMIDANPITPLPLKIIGMDAIARDIVRLELARPEGGELPAFRPGSHVFVQTPNGLLRQYSLCNAPSEHHRYVIAVKRDTEGRGGSKSMADDLKVGETLFVSEPRDAFPFAEAAASYLFIAGGIGITPIRAMMLHLIATGVNSFKLYYCTRSPEETAFRHDFTAPEFGRKVVMHHDGGNPAHRLDLWPVLESPGRTHLYCCGPTPLMQAVRDMSGHWPSSQVHFEDFASAKPKPRPDDKPFIVRLAKSGKSLKVSEGMTLLEALLAAGIRIPCSCESGVCGSCRVGLLEGEADHRDFVLSESERLSGIMPCVSRAHSPLLVLDL